MLSTKLGVRVCSRPQRAGLCILCIALLIGTTPGAIAQQKLETAPDVNARIQALAEASKVKQGEYVIGAGDLIHIEVFDVPELSRELRVGESGYISVPLLPGRVRAGGLTTFQLEEKLAELLQTNGLVSHPQVSVSLKEQHSQPITVVGAVKNPLVYQAVRPTSLLEIISLAGGIQDDAGNVVLVTRRPAAAAPADAGAPAAAPSDLLPGPSQIFSISLSDLIESGDSKYNIPLIGGDIVSVPRAGVVYVVGAVEKPGGFVLQNDRADVTTLKVLALAGGLKSTAKPRQAVIVRKNPDTGARQEVNVDISRILERKSEDVQLLPSDILFVPDSSGKKALRRVGEAAIAMTTGVALIRLGR